MPITSDTDTTKCDTDGRLWRHRISSCQDAFAICWFEPVDLFGTEVRERQSQGVKANSAFRHFKIMRVNL